MYTTHVIHAEVSGDNSSAYLLATNHCLSKQLKHLNVKWDFFWEYVDEGQVKISECSTDDQQADYLKFVLVFEKFGNNRISNQGW